MLFDYHTGLFTSQVIQPHHKLYFLSWIYLSAHVTFIFKRAVELQDLGLNCLCHRGTFFSQNSSVSSNLCYCKPVRHSAAAGQDSEEGRSWSLGFHPARTTYQPGNAVQPTPKGNNRGEQYENTQL